MLLKVGSGYSWNRVLSQRKPRRTAWILEIFCFLLWMPVKRVHSVCENSSRVSLIFHFLYIYYNFKKNFQKRDFILYFKLVKNSLHMKDCQSLQFVNTSLATGWRSRHIFIPLPDLNTFYIFSQRQCWNLTPSPQLFLQPSLQFYEKTLESVIRDEQVCRGRKELLVPRSRPWG